MNKIEQRYAAELDLQLRAGLIVGWKFEGMKLRLADRTFYTPDFDVWLSGDRLEFHETKGHFEDDARVKLKVAAESFPNVFRVLAYDYDRAAFVEREVLNAERVP